MKREYRADEHKIVAAAQTSKAMTIARTDGLLNNPREATMRGASQAFPNAAMIGNSPENPCKTWNNGLKNVDCKII